MQRISEAAVTVPVTQYSPNGVMTRLPVCFSICREENRFRAVPQLSREEQRATGLPAELVFVYIDQCIVSANDMEEETLQTIKEIILQLEEQELPWLT